MDVLPGKIVSSLARHGISLFGSRVLSFPGPTTGRLQRVPANLLQHEDRRYIVAIRGNTQWVRNVRAAGEAQLPVGRQVETVTLRELPTAQRVPVLRLYLTRWGWEVSQFTEGLGKDSTDDELLAAAPGIPAFEVCPAANPPR